MTNTGERDDQIFGMTPAVLELQERAAKGRREMMARLAATKFVKEEGSAEPFGSDA